jgi:hypothetical protein
MTKTSFYRVSHYVTGSSEVKNPLVANEFDAGDNGVISRIQRWKNRRFFMGLDVCVQFIIQALFQQ